jgi:hypothetical protein
MSFLLIVFVFVFVVRFGVEVEGVPELDVDVERRGVRSPIPDVDL